MSFFYTSVQFLTRAVVLSAAPVLLLLILGLSGCSDRSAAPGFSDDLTQVSVPQPGQLPYFRGVVMDPYWPPAQVDSERALPADLRGLKSVAAAKASSLRDHDDRGLADADLRGRHTLVYFFYATCSGICPLLTANVRRLAGQLEFDDASSDLQIIAITVDPERDGQKQLANYRAKHGITNAKWRFFTGQSAEIREIARDQFAGEIQTREGLGAMLDFVHTENVFLLDRQGYLRGIYRARGTGDLERLKIELQTLRSQDA